VGNPQLLVLVRQRIVAWLDPGTAMLAAMEESGTGSAAQDEARRMLYGTAWGAVWSYAIAPLLENAFAQTDATAWICASDGSAMAAGAFLGRRGGRRISLCGFDNTPEAFSERLTSYDFNQENIVERMVAYVLTPPRRQKRFRQVPIEVDGILVERESTWRVPAAP
jgi:DNA-binding LacI/PurR family transcriptional regulator